ncbi:hypothetical protein BJX70DRAFT_357432 [Aspergillus crustosus]
MSTSSCLASSVQACLLLMIWWDILGECVVLWIAAVGSYLATYTRRLQTQSNITTFL